MGLENIYDNLSKKRVNMTQTSSSLGGVIKQRDPKVQKLEGDIFNKLSQVTQEEAPKKHPQGNVNTKTPTPIKEVGVEQALKELRDMGQSS